MNLKTKLTRLEKAAVQVVSSLSPEEWARLEALNQMGEDHPDYDLLEHIELYLRTKPKKTFEELLEELEEVEHAEEQAQ